MSVQLTSHLLELPPAWLALLFQHVASGHGGLGNAAALSQTCTFLHSLSEGPAVTYINLFWAAAISSPGHPFWQWIVRRSGRVDGLSITLSVGENDDELSAWMQPLQTLSTIHSLQLRVEWVGIIDDMDHTCVAQWLKQHGQLISHLTVEVEVSEDRLKLREFSEAAAPCRSISLAIQHDGEEVDLADLHPVAGSLKRLTCETRGDHDSIIGASAFSSMSQLTYLELLREDFQNEEPWEFLARLPSLQQLDLSARATGDPSPLSALTQLTSLHLQSCGHLAPDRAPFSFSSLQPLSTLRQLEVLQLDTYACAATSLQGLAGLSSLKLLELKYADNLMNLEGISSGLTNLLILSAHDLVRLAGIEGCTSLEKLTLDDCGVSSLRPLMGLSSLKQLAVSQCNVTSLEGLRSMSLQSLTLKGCHCLTQLSGVEHLSALTSLEVRDCGVTSLQPLSQLGEGLQLLTVCWCKEVHEEVLELPHVQPTADVVVVYSNVKEVVLAEGVRRAVRQV
jgi:hypothetical protein